MKKGINNPGFRALPSSVQNNILSNMKYGGKKYATGGAMPMEQLTEFNEGGTHEENPLGGIPQGMNPSGQMNLVEEGETKFDAENYIFSDSLKVDKELAEAFNLSPKMIGKTFSDASKMAGRKKSKREGDAIEMAANEKDLMNLMEAQEAFKQKEVQEKLAEIEALDPNALPALMGQGQDPNMMQDPAMGGQMQEAPMDEQAMMEQQMMAEQQAGGGQPSPEEMAMMQQQQDMAMGQQEGMMRGGGSLYNTMYDNEGGMDYPNDYPNYGGLGRIKKAEGPMTEDEAQMIEAYKRHQETLNTIDRITKKPNYLVTGEPLAGDLLPLDTYRKWWNMPRRRLNYVSKTGRDAPPEAEKLGGYLGDGKSSFGGGGYMSRSYAPGGFMGMTNTLGDPPNISTDSRNSAQGQGDFTFKHSDTGIDKRNPMNSFYENQGYQKEYVMDPNNPEVTQQVFIDPNNPKQSKLTGNRVKMFRMAQKGKLPLVQGEYDGSYATGGILDGGFQGQGINPMQGLGSQMRKGGKLCYGCGGAMHAYGGRTNKVQPNQAKYGKFLDLYSNFLGTGASILGNIPVVGQAVGAGLGALSGITGSLAENARTSEDGKVDWRGIDYGDMGLQAGKGAGSGALGFAGSTLTNLGGQAVDSLTTSKYEEREAAHQDIINNPEKYSEEEYEAALAKEQDRGKGSTLFNIANQAMGVAGSIAGGKIGKGAENTMGEVTDSVIETAPEIELPNMTKYGGNLYKNGGGLWANIHAKRARIAAGSGERMRKKGSKGAPTDEAIKAAQKQMGGNLDEYTTDTTFEDGGKLTLMKQITQPDGTLINKSVTYNSLQELLADSEIVQKYGGKENVKELFAEKFQDSNVPYQTTMMDNIVSPDPIYTRVGDMEAQSPLTEQEMAATQITPRQAEILQNTRNQLEITPDKLAELEAARNLERAVDSENPVFNPEVVDTKEDVNPLAVVEPTEEEKETPKAKSTEEGEEKKDPDMPDANDISDAKFDFNYKESFPQFAAKYAAPLYNIGSGLFSKQKDYIPDFVPLETPKFDATQALNNVKRQVSGLRKNLNKVGANPSNLLALAQSGSRLENETLMTYDKLQKELDFRGNQYNTKQKQNLEKYKKQLEMSFDEAKRKSIQEGIKQMGKIQETEAANYLAAQYNAMSAPSLGTFEYTPFLQGLLERMNKNDKNQ